MKKNHVTGRYTEKLSKYLAYGSIVFMQSPDDYHAAMHVLDREGMDGLTKYLMMWDDDDGYTGSDVWDVGKRRSFPFGDRDELYFTEDDYCVVLNRNIGYVGLYYCFDDEAYAYFLGN